MVVSFLTLYSMIKIFRYVFWNVQQGPDEPQPGGGARVAAVATLVVTGVALGLGATWAVPYATMAADQLIDPTAYIEAVLGAR